MIVIPAIDLKDGRCVRLKQGDMGTATVFSDDPVAMATAMRLAVEAGRHAYLAGRIPKKLYAAASSPMASNTTTKASLAYFNLRVTAVTRDSSGCGRRTDRLCGAPETGV